MTARPEPIRAFHRILDMFWIEIYVWAMVICTIACVRIDHINELAEWACASLAGAIWPATIAIRVHRAVRREVRRD